MIHAAFSTSHLIRRSIAALLLSTLALPAVPDPPAPTFANVSVHDPSVVRDIVEVPAVPLGRRVVAWKYGIHTFWRRWTGRQSSGSSTTNETPD